MKKNKRNKKGVISLEKIIVSSAIAVLSGVALTTAYDTSKDVANTGNDKMIAKTEEIVQADIKPTTPPEPEEKPIDESKSTMKFSIAVGNEGNDVNQSHFGIGGVPLNFKLGYKTATENNVFSKGRENFIWSESMLKKNFGSNQYETLPGFSNGMMIYKNGNELSTKNNEMGGMSTFMSAEYTEQDMKEIRSFLIDNADKLKPNKDFGLSMNFIGSEGLKYKNIKVGSYDFTAEDIKKIHEDPYKPMKISGSALSEAVHSHRINEVSESRKPLSYNDTDKHIVYNSESKEFTKQTLRDYLTKDGPTNVPKFKARQLNSVHKLVIPIRIESTGGLVYSFDYTFSFYLTFIYDFGG